MTSIYQWDEPKESSRGVFVPLIIATLGTVGVIVLYFVLPGFQAIEMLALLLAIAVTAVGFSQRIVRGLLSLVSLYSSSAIAAYLYGAAAPSVARTLASLANPFSTAPSQSVTVTKSMYGLTFALLTIAIYALLEVISRAAIPDTALPKLRAVDNVGGILVYVVVAILAASLLFNTMGYGRLRSSHNRAQFRDAFNEVLQVHYDTQSFWFSDAPPSILVYDLDL